jgi:hypothetical protein
MSVTIHEVLLIEAFTAPILADHRRRSSRCVSCAWKAPSAVIAWRIVLPLSARLRAGRRRSGIGHRRVEDRRGSSQAVRSGPGRAGGSSGWSAAWRTSAFIAACLSNTSFIEAGVSSPLSMRLIICWWYARITGKAARFSGSWRIRSSSSLSAVSQRTRSILADSARRSARPESASCSGHFEYHDCRASRGDRPASRRWPDGEPCLAPPQTLKAIS